jgi:hypothetical protein
MQQDIADNFNNARSCLSDIPIQLNSLLFTLPEFMDYVKGFIPVRLNGELYTIPGFLPIACTSGSGFVYAFCKETQLS